MCVQTSDEINKVKMGDNGSESRSWRGVLDTTLCDKVCQ
jgi:hypothetical protein